MKNYIWTFLFLILQGMTHVSQAQNHVETKSDSIRLSLLTCTAGEEVYSLFGHTAIRYENFTTKEDIIFNYGIFSFSTPNFVWRFVKGETDYKLGVGHYANFKLDYLFQGRGIYQQVLNLTPVEKKRLLDLLIENYLPENRTYRYNFFFDNCATRPRDKIEEAIDGTIKYTTIDYRMSFRDVVRQFSKGYEWDRFGMDFCLGSEADKPITYREEMFSPYYLMDAFAMAQIVKEEGTVRPLVAETTTLLEKEEGSSGSMPFTPLRTFLLLFIAITFVTIYGLKKKKALWGIDLLLFALAGLAGCVVFLLSFFSEHPTVSPNYLIFAFHPLHLLLLPFFILKEKKEKRSIYHTINAIVLTLFILLWWAIPQHFNLAVLPLALCLLVRSTGHLILTYKKNK